MLLNKFDKDVQEKLVELQLSLKEKPKQNLKYYGFRVDPEVIKFLDSYSQITRIPVSQMVREGIQLYLQQLEKRLQEN